ncbi:unnamed protein product [Dicrocoelium dendriticum]|nr:unnamed protein product [Dicrocoelium dendriticum]
MDIFCIDYFRTNPEPFFKLAKRLYKPEAKPTLAHYFVKLLHKKNLLKRHYTQNVDDLETLCGLPEETIVQAHGSFQTGHCLKCRKIYDFEWMKGKFHGIHIICTDLIMNDQIPRCSEQDCHGVVKPDVVFFGEGLPRKFFSCIQQDLRSCDLLIIMGTSLTVAPFCSIPHLTSPETYRVYINRDAPDVTFPQILKQQSTSPRRNDPVGSNQYVRLNKENLDQDTKAINVTGPLDSSYHAAFLSDTGTEVNLVPHTSRQKTIQLFSLNVCVTISTFITGYQRPLTWVSA